MCLILSSRANYRISSLQFIPISGHRVLQPLKKSKANTVSSVHSDLFLRVDLNPLKKKFTRSYVRNIKMIFRPFLEFVQKTCQVHFSCLLQLGSFCKGPRTLQNFPQKCGQKIVGLSARRLCTPQLPIARASKPGSSPLEGPGPDNITSQPWSDAMCPVTPLLVLCLAFFNKKNMSVTAKHQKKLTIVTVRDSFLKLCG